MTEIVTPERQLEIARGRLRIAERFLRESIAQTRLCLDLIERRAAEGMTLGLTELSVAHGCVERAGATVTERRAQVQQLESWVPFLGEVSSS